MKVKATLVLKFIHVITWAGFLGICVKAGALMYSFWVSLHQNSVAANNLYMGLNLGQLKAYSITQYSILVCCIFLIFVLQALLFFVVLKIFKHINLFSPFHEKIRTLIFNLSILSFCIGLVCKLTVGFSERFTSVGMNFPHLMEHIGSGDAFVFFGGILFFISVLFKRGIELQTENDLTI